MSERDCILCTLGNMHQIIQISTTSTEYDLLNNSRILQHIPGTYDTYKCTDCGSTMSGYKRGDPHLNEHIWSGEARCRYIMTKFKNRKNELKIIQGQLRLQRGFLAFPNSVLHATDGYVLMQGTKCCVFCTRATTQDHFIACPDMISHLKRNLRSMRLARPFDITPLYFDDDLESDSVSALPLSRLNLLGDRANMQHISGTLDEHVCFQCKLQLKSFLRNDTLLGEHIYHVYNNGFSCSYLEERFCKDREKLDLILGQERFRKGYVAFPNAVTYSSGGAVVINGLKRCVVCACHVFTQGHDKYCEYMQKELNRKLKEMKLL